MWFPEDPRQTPWTRFLDELARAGYDWLELGPYGYLPTETETLRTELEARGLRLAGGTVGGPLHRREELPTIEAEMFKVARLASAFGAEHLVFLPAMYRDLADGRQLERAQLQEGKMAGARRGRGPPRAGPARGDRDSVRVPPSRREPRRDRRADPSLPGRHRPELVGLCLDTGHVAYRHGDAPRLLREHADRIWYVHLKAVDPAVLAQVEAEQLSFADAVKRDVMCEPGLGVPALDDLIAGLRCLPADTFVIVEQDLYPCDFDRPYPIAARTREALQTTGIG